MENTASAARLNSRTRQWLLTQLQLIEESYGNPLPKTPAQAESLVFGRATCQAEYVHLARCLLSKTLAMAQTGGGKGSGDLSQSPPIDLQHFRVSDGQHHGVLPNNRSPFEFPSGTMSPLSSSPSISRKRPARSPSCPLFNDDKSLWQPHFLTNNSKRRGSQIQSSASDQSHHLTCVGDSVLSTQVSPESLLYRSTTSNGMAPLLKNDTVRIITRQDGFSHEQKTTVKEPSKDTHQTEATIDENSVYGANFTLLVPRGTRISEVLIHLAEKD